MNRFEILQTLPHGSKVDVLIIGGGINGIGAFRDLALQGVDVLLVERGDFCSGASAASSHMAHGGIRYLENGEFHLVREAVQERNRLIQNAPHLVKPLPTTIPIFKIFSGLLNAPLKFLGWLEHPSERGAIVIKIGLIFYDSFTRAQRTVPPHVFDPRPKALEKFPRLNPSIKYAATYYDGSIFSPERLAVELLLDGEAEGPHARAVNYMSLVGGEGGQEVVLKDEISGELHKIAPRLVINAAGPWIDAANQRLGLRTHYIGGTKGSHLVLDHPALRHAIRDHEFFFENRDGRIVLIFPLEDKVIVGTSDIPVDDPDSVRCTPQEEQYFLDLVSRVFPDIPVKPEQIVFRFSGVRPLAYTQARLAGQITRNHHIQEDALGQIPVFSLVGGKWTSFRVFSEQVTDRVLPLLGRRRKRDTKDLPIGGGGGYPRGASARSQFVQQVHEQSGLPLSRVELLFDRYGTRAKEMAAFLSSQEDETLVSLPSMTHREVFFLSQREKVVHLDDLLLRRTMLAYLGMLTRSAVEELAKHLGQSLRWSGKEQQVEVERALRILADDHGVHLL